jgi:hypothetical protein
MPHDGGMVLPEIVHVKPFHFKFRFDSRLDERVLSGAVGFNGLPSGHSNLDRRHPGLKENILEGITIVKMPSAPFGPDEVKEEAT